MRISLTAGALAASLSGAQEREASAGRGTIVVLVKASDGGQPLPYADVTVEGAALAAFTGAKGQVEFKSIPAGAARVRVRRLGFAPTTVSVTVAANRSDTIDVRLAALSLRLERVRVTDAVCPNRERSTIDTAIVAILQQVQMNAERNRMLAHEYPFETTFERKLGVARVDEFGVAAPRPQVIRVDTIVLPGEHAWRYAPGKLIVPNTEASVPNAREAMVIPQLVDFADDPFVAAHCFRYAGLETVDGRRMIRVDFEPIKAIREPDVRGSLYFDARSYEIHRSTLYLERPSPLSLADVWEVQVNTWFREIFPTLPVIDRVSQKTTARSIMDGRRALENATEEHRLLDLRFLGHSPGDHDPAELRKRGVKCLRMVDGRAVETDC